MQKLHRSKNTGRFISTAHARRLRTLRKNASLIPDKIVAGRLYDFQGIPVRALGIVEGQRLVTSHKRLAGLVSDSELKLLTPKNVGAYLKNA